MTLDKAAMLQGIVALGIIAGSILAGRLVNLRSSIKVLPVGVFMGLVVPLMTLASNIGTASILLIIIGTLAGFFVVPMNALLQHRGYVTLSAGQSIAVQNFNENSNVLVMLTVYSFLLFFNMSANTVVTLFGIFVAITMALVIAKYRRNKSTIEFDTLIGDRRSSVYQK